MASLKALDIEFLVTSILQLSPPLKEAFWTNLWARMTPYDLYLVQKHLDPVGGGFSKSALIPNLKADNGSSNRPRFDVVDSSADLPEVLETICSHLTISDMQSAIQVSKRWASLFCQEKLYARRLGGWYPADFKVLDLCHTFRRGWKWLAFHCQEVERELSTQPKFTHARVDVKFCDYLLSIEANGAGRAVAVARRPVGIQALSWDLHRPFHTGRFLDLAISPSAISVDPSGAWMAVGTYLRQDSGPHLYSLDSGELLYKPSGTSTAITALLAFRAILSDEPTSLLITGASDGSVCLWLIPPDLGLAQNRPEIVATLVSEARNAILGFSFIPLTTVIVASRSGVVVSYQLQSIATANAPSSRRFELVQTSLLTLTTLTTASEDNMFLKFRARASNLALASSTTLYHVMAAPIPGKVPGNRALVLLSCQPIPCYPGSIDFTSLPLAAFDPETRAVTKTPFQPGSLRSGLLSVFGVWCVNPRPSLTIPIFLYSPLTAGWSQVQGTYPRGQSAFTCLKSIGTDTLVLGGRDGHLHVVKLSSRFPSNLPQMDGRHNQG
ncbi:hypothetical protein L0F63_001773, partial [Massospora cicadina]